MPYFLLPPLPYEPDELTWDSLWDEDDDTANNPYRFMED